MGHKNHHKTNRQLSAKDRKEAREARSNREQLARLDRLLGKDQGAKKERKRLLKSLEG